ncbi:MAG TPA: UDP-N-acetylmuramoyl-L-alanyl-D-glutamate--2,6-diaminopimelate ligase [Acidimicrobiia bacterium]|nr:UDP-N-acetylmuramoyl-L-alanyl-D-glutamate--2,6-diaminopimelate ligase [Acidimicrobiia bacterium]
MRLHELLADVDVVERAGDPDTEVTSVVHDSTRVTRGSCFCCIRGARADGHDYAPDAVVRGATALLVERLLPLDVSQARVANVRRALGPVSATFFGHPSDAMRCLGVTGTNGKTTTTMLLDAIAVAAGERTGIVGTVGARIAGRAVALERTTPEASELQQLFARMRDDGVTTVSMEVSSHALAQHRVDGTRFAAACFTNLSTEHLDFHRSLDAYFEAKALLFEPARTRAAAVNLDDRYGVELARRCACARVPLTTFAVDDGAADVQARDLHTEQGATRFTLVHVPSGARAPVTLSLAGTFNVSNALAAGATALAAGFELDAVVTGLSTPVTVPGRMERVGRGAPFTVLVDYAHTPVALEHALAGARELCTDGRVIVVFGCGGDRDREKRPMMGEAAAQGADFVVVTSDNPRSEDPAAIVQDVQEGLRHGAPYTIELDRRAAIRLALERARPGDVVVVAGKGHETTQTIGDRVVPFDDRVVAAEELERLGWT